MTGFTHQAPFLILQLLLLLTLTLIMPMLMPLPRHMRTPCSSEEAQQELMRYPSMALRLHHLLPAPLTFRTRLWRQ